MKKYFIFKIFSMTIGICAAFVAAELIARSMMPVPLYYPRFSMEKGTSRVYQGVVLWDTRSDGMETHARAAAKRTSRFRIAGLGDSIMYGSGVARKDTYITRLAGALEKSSGIKTDIVDLSQPGYNLRQEAALFDLLGVQTKPDLVIVHAWEDDLSEYLVVGGVVYGSDVYSKTGVVRTIPLPSAINEYLILRSRLYQYLSLLAMIHKENRADRIGRGSETCKQALEALYENSQKSNARMLILLSPDLGARIQPFKTSPDKHALYFTINEWAKSRDVDVIDLTEKMAGIDGRTIGVDGIHFNKKGHDMVLQILTGYIPDRYMQPAPAVPLHRP